MLDPQTALSAAARPLPAVAPATQRVLVVGGGGRLGSAVLECALAEHRFARVGVLALPPFGSALRRLHAVAPDVASQSAFAPDTALVVFDSPRHANGREARLVQPQPAALLEQARALLDAGAKRLVVVVPHGAAALPQALRGGLATLDEAAVAALGFTHLVFVRAAGATRPTAAAGVLQRVGAAMLSQLQWMVPQREQALRPVVVARFVAALAAALPAAAAGTRVASPELMWDWAQPGGGDAVLQAWLRGEAPPAVAAPLRRW